MAVIHIYTSNGKTIYTTKEPFLGKEKPLSSPPSWRNLFSKNISCVVFKFPTVLRTCDIKLICFALMAFLVGKYYTRKVPRLLSSFLDAQEKKTLFFIGGAVGADLVKFHYAQDEDVIIEGVETINIIAKRNHELTRRLHSVQPSDIRKKIFIVGLFSPDLLKFLRKKYPFAKIELRYFDVLRQNRLSEFEEIKEYARENHITISVYDHATSSRFNVPYEMNKVNAGKLLNYQKKQKKYDACFLAGYSPDREKALRPLLRSLKKANLNVKLLLVNYPFPEIEGYRVDKSFLTYENYLNLVGESRAIIDLWRLAPNEGYSFRIAEAFALCSKVITNRPCLLDEPFYDPSRIFTFNEESEIDPEAIKQFLISSMKPVENSIFNIGKN